MYDKHGLGCIYATGGCWENTSSSGEKYDEQTQKWLTIKKMKYPRRHHALVSLTGKLTDFLRINSHLFPFYLLKNFWQLIHDDFH